MKMKDVLFVPGLKKNLLSILALDTKGMRVAFVDGQVLMWSKGKTIDDAIVIGEHEGGLYKLKGHPEQALVHDTVLDDDPDDTEKKTCADKLCRENTFLVKREC